LARHDLLHEARFLFAISYSVRPPDVERYATENGSHIIPSYLLAA
jgi:hypothetical protein